MPGIKRIVFDAFGVLFDTVEIERELVGFAGKDLPGIDRTWRQKLAEYTWMRSLMKQYRPFNQIATDALNYALNKHKVTISIQDWNVILELFRNLPLFPGVRENLEKLAPYYELGILSNGDEALLETLVQANGLTCFKDRLFSADQVRTFKPKPEVYNLVFDGGLVNEQVLFVAANGWDVAGARSAGLQVAWINSRGDIMEELDQSPNLTYTSLEKMVEVFMPVE